MELVFLILTILALVATVVLGFLQVVVPFIKGEVRFSKTFPFVESAEKPLRKRRKKKAQKRRRFLIPIIAVIVVILIIVLIRFLVFQTRAVERVPIAVMSFTNRTGDAQYDYLCEAIPNLLITNLEQSQYLSVMTWERMHDLLRMLGKEGIRVVTEDIGFELCRMDNIDAVVIGSFTKAGNRFVTEAKVVDVETKKLLKSTSSDGDGVASILKIQIDELSRDISSGVSAYERAVKPTQYHIIDVTTASMDAYNYYLRGKEDWEKFHWSESRRFLEKAIELDSTFASAYLWLSIDYRALRENEARVKALTKAKILSHRATEKERLLIEADYAGWIEGDRDKSFRFLRQLTTKYPQEKYARVCVAGRYAQDGRYDKARKEYEDVLALDPYYGIALNALAYMYIEMGLYDSAMVYFEQYASAAPGDANPFDSMGDLYFRLGQIDKALTKYKEAVDLEPDFYSSLKIAYIYVLKESYAEAMKWLDHYIMMAPSSSVRAVGYRYKAFVSNQVGEVDQAQRDLDMIKEALEPAERASEQKVTDWLQGWMYYDRGEYDASRDYFKRGVADLYAAMKDSSFTEITHNFPLGLVDVQQADYVSARGRLETISGLLPDVDPEYAELAQFYCDFLYVALLLAQDSLEKASIISEKTRELTVDEPPGSTRSDDRYLAVLASFNKNIVARVYIAKGEMEKAIDVYERLTAENPNERNRFVVRPIWRYELAKLYEEEGLTTKAAEQYKKFLDIWKDADEDLPDLIDAKKRLAALQKS